MQLTPETLNTIDDLGDTTAASFDDGKRKVPYANWVLARIIQWETSPDGGLSLDNLRTFHPVKHYEKEMANRSAR